MARVRGVTRASTSLRVQAPAAVLVQRATGRRTPRAATMVPAVGGHCGSGMIDLVARLEHRLEEQVEGVDAAVGDQHLVRATDRDAVLRAQLVREQFLEPRHAGRLQVVRPVVVDRPGPSPRLTVSGASKLTSPWSSRNGFSTPYIMSRMRMMPEKGMESMKCDMDHSIDDLRLANSD